MIDVERFIDGYIECALWADCQPFGDHPYNPGPFCAKCAGLCLMEESPESGGGEGLELRHGAREKMAVDCRAFCEANESDLDLYVQQRLSAGGWPPDRSAGELPIAGASSSAGHDFWLTRSGHGTGFWDRGLGELGERLSEAARAYGSPDDHTPFDCGDGTADV